MCQTNRKITLSRREQRSRAVSATGVPHVDEIANEAETEVAAPQSAFSTTDFRNSDGSVRNCF